MLKPSEYDIVILPNDHLRSEVILDVINDEGMPVIDRDAMFSMLFSFINEILLEVISIETVFHWVVYETMPVVEESEKIFRNEKMSMLKELISEFMKAWIIKLKEEGIIENDNFAYDFTGLLRDGSYVFQRQNSVHRSNRHI